MKNEELGAQIVGGAIGFGIAVTLPFIATVVGSYVLIEYGIKSAPYVTKFFEGMKNFKRDDVTV